MPLRFLSLLIAYFTGEKRAISGRIDHAEEDHKNRIRRGTIIIEIDHGKYEQQNGTERGAIIQNRNEIDKGEDKQRNGIEIGAIIQNRNETDQKEGDYERICERYLPQELVIESILTRLPARSLAVFSGVSKLWYNSIYNDSRFSAIHYIQNRQRLSLVFNLLNNVLRSGSEMVYFFSLGGVKDQADSRVKFLTGFDTKNTHELVGFCNGLACTKLVDADNDDHGLITVVNPIWNETLVLSYLPPTVGYIYLCHGFGFDPLSQVYKAVIIFASEANTELLCMVITLGTMSWRKIITSTFDISPSPGSSLYPSPMVSRVPRMLWRPATFCGGDLFWRTENQVGDNNDKIEMLLSFDLHNEKIHFIRLPTECTPTTATNEHRYLVVDHLLEFKGYPCIARCEGIATSNNDHCGHRCNYQTGVCCCCCKLHMYILKDKDKQVWTREETFDVQIMDREGLLPTPLCGYFDASAATPPTRILTFSDQVLLYWFNGKSLILYNLQEKHLKVVECSRSYPSVFQTKMNEDLERLIGDDDNIYCPSMDYQLHAQVENIVSLKTFIPKEAKTIKTDCADEVNRLMDKNPATGWLMTGRLTNTYYVFS